MYSLLLATTKVFCEWRGVDYRVYGTLFREPLVVGGGVRLWGCNCGVSLLQLLAPRLFVKTPQPSQLFQAQPVVQDSHLAPDLLPPSSKLQSWSTHLPWIAAIMTLVSDPLHFLIFAVNWLLSSAVDIYFFMLFFFLKVQSKGKKPIRPDCYRHFIPRFKPSTIDQVNNTLYYNGL